MYAEALILGAVFVCNRFISCSRIDLSACTVDGFNDDGGEPRRCVQKDASHDQTVQTISQWLSVTTARLSWLNPCPMATGYELEMGVNQSFVTAWLSCQWPFLVCCNRKSFAETETNDSWIELCSWVAILLDVSAFESKLFTSLLCDVDVLVISSI